MRLQKVLAGWGVASRRACELMVLDGRVKVNGHLVTSLPAWVNPVTDRVSVDGRAVRPASTRGAGDRRTGARRGVYVLLHKPRRVISTAHDPQGRRCVTEMVPLPPPWSATRLFPVGRLDADTTGLILLTNDGELAHRLTHPSFEVSKRYLVSVRGRLTEPDLQRLKKGLYLTQVKRSPVGEPGGASGGDSGEGRSVGVKRASVAQVKVIGYQRDPVAGERTKLAVTLREGQNRQIRRMLADLGFKVRRLARVGIGPLRIKGLGSGQWRMLTGTEVRMLFKRVGLASPSNNHNRSGAMAKGLSCTP